MYAIYGYSKSHILYGNSDGISTTTHGMSLVTMSTVHHYHVTTQFCTTQTMLLHRGRAKTPVAYNWSMGNPSTVLRNFCIITGVRSIGTVLSVMVWCQQYGVDIKETGYASMCGFRRKFRPLLFWCFTLHLLLIADTLISYDVNFIRIPEVQLAVINYVQRTPPPHSPMQQYCR